jgi:hypothetical protein
MVRVQIERPECPAASRCIAQAVVEKSVKDAPVERLWDETHGVAQRLRRRRGRGGEELGEPCDHTALADTALMVRLVGSEGGAELGCGRGLLGTALIERPQPLPQEVGSLDRRSSACTAQQTG